jgi:hypothetical protein
MVIAYHDSQAPAFFKALIGWPTRMPVTHSPAGCMKDLEDLDAGVV